MKGATDLSMAGPVRRRPGRINPHHQINPCFIVCLLLLPLFCISKESPHAIKKLAWQILTQTGEEVWRVTANHAPYSWWLPLTPDFCQLAAGLDSWDIPTIEHTELNKNQSWSTQGTPQTADAGCSTPTSRSRLAQSDFYVCPKDGRSRAMVARCGEYKEFFCKAWACETTGAAYWHPSSSWDLITVTRGFKKIYTGASGCYHNSQPKWLQYQLLLPLTISFTQKGKDFQGWPSGRTWGFRWYLKGFDAGVIFKIQLKVENLNTISIGPNPVLPNTQSKIPAPFKVSATLRPTSGDTPSPRPNSTPLITTQPVGNRLFNLVQGAYMALNATSPDKTLDCWLCLTSSPPFYEGIAFQFAASNLSSPSNRCQTNPHRLTLSEVSEQGSCLGKVPSTHQHLCNQTTTPTKGSYYLEAPNGSYWACNTGLTPCVSAQIFNNSHEFCVLVQLWPRVTYHEENSVIELFEQRGRYTREPVSMTIALLLGIGGIAAGIGTGTTALVQNNHLMQLQMVMTTNLEAIERSISALEKSLTSLSEVVLQNRRGLDLLFLKEGGLCAALKEECCFYADHTGIVRESMEKLRERLAQRKREFENQQGWFENWLQGSPWLSTLLPTILAPLIVLLLLITFGPWAFQRLTRFIKSQIDSALPQHILIHYHRLDTEENGQEPSQRLRFSALGS